MPGQTAFLPLSPLPFPNPTRSFSHPLVCSATPPRRRPSHPLPLLAAALLTAITPSLPVHAKELRYDGRQELDSGEKAMSLTLTGGTFAALAVWAYKQNRRDDILEEVRIKDEVERLEKLKAEFLDVEEDDIIDDEELLASLRERIGEGDGEGEGDGDEEGEEGSDDQDDPENEDGNDVDMLKRMWDATDGDDDKSKP